MDDEKKLAEGAATPPEDEKQNDVQADSQPAEGVSLDKPSQEKPADGENVSAPVNEEAAQEAAAQPADTTPANTGETPQETAANEEEAPEVASPVYVNQESAQNAETAPKKGNKGLLAGVAVLVVIAIVGVFAGPKLFASPMAKVIEAMADTSLNSMGESPLSQATGMGDAFDFAVTGNTTIKGQLVLEQLPASIDDGGPGEGLGVYMQMDTDMIEEAFYFDMGLLMNTAKLANMELFGDNEKASLAIPALYEGYLSMPLQNIGAAYKQSIFQRYQPLDIEDDYSFSFFSTETEESFVADAAVLGVKHAEWGTRLQKDMTAEKIDQVDLPAGDSTVSCQGYKLSITDDKANLFYQDYLSFWQTDEDAQALINDFATAYGAQNSGGNLYYAQQVEEEFKEEIDWILENLKDLSFSNVSYTCYVDSNNLIRKVLLEGTVITLDGEELDVILDVQLAGEDRVVDDMNIDLQLTMDGDVASIHIMNRQYVDEETVVAEGSMIVSNPYEDLVDGRYEFTYNTADNSYVLDSKLNADGDNITFTSNGLLEIPVKGISFNLIMDSIKMTVTEYGQTETMELSGNFSLDELTEPLKQPSGTEYPIFEINESQFQGLVFEIYENIMQLEEQIGAVLEQ